MNETVAHTGDGTMPSVGTRLRAAREASGKSLADVAALTRVPVRLLSALERDAVEELPAGPYATGFTKAFAQAVGLNPDEIVAQARVLQQERVPRTSYPLDPYEPADDSRVPPRSVALIAGVIFLALLSGYFVLRDYAMAPASPTAGVGATAPTATAATGATSSSAPGGVSVAVPVAVPVTAPPTVTLPVDARVIVKAYQRALFSLDDANGRSVFDLTLDGPLC